jgi:RNA polymerase sigma factor (TIGR02999 family)
MQGVIMPSELNTNDISRLLRAWSGGDQSALNGLTPIVYEELRRLAHHYMERERPGHTLQTTALVNEAYMRLTDYTRMQWQDRAHFFAVAAQVMRRILVGREAFAAWRAYTVANMQRWNRSASLLGREIEELIRTGLVSQFPEKEFPVNIDVLGGQSQTYASVHITNSDAGIDERAQAIPENFLGTGGTVVAVLTTVERMLTDLKNAGRLPMTT